MNPIARILITTGIALIAGGLIWHFGARLFGSLPFGKLPGDIAIERGNFRFYFPIVSSLVLSALVSLLLYLFRR